MSQTSPIFGIPWIIFMAFGVALLTYWFAHHTAPAGRSLRSDRTRSRRRSAVSA
jgi:hypothetical protein